LPIARRRSSRLGGNTEIAERRPRRDTLQRVACAGWRGDDIGGDGPSCKGGYVCASEWSQSGLRLPALRLPLVAKDWLRRQAGPVAGHEQDGNACHRRYRRTIDHGRTRNDHARHSDDGPRSNSRPVAMP